MKKVNVSEAKSRLGRMLDEVKQGENFIICERNVPVATLEALKTGHSSKIKVGLLKNQFIVPDDFDDDLKEFEKVYYGE